jgi:hypothetical protein
MPISNSNPTRQPIVHSHSVAEQCELWRVIRGRISTWQGRQYQRPCRVLHRHTRRRSRRLSLCLHHRHRWLRHQRHQHPRRLHMKRQRLRMQQRQRNHNSGHRDLKTDRRQRRPPFARREMTNPRLNQTVLKHRSTLQRSDSGAHLARDAAVTTLDTCAPFMFPRQACTNRLANER